jgi:hypothetical protein
MIFKTSINYFPNSIDRLVFTAESEITCKILVGMPEGKRTLERRRRNEKISQK